MKNMIIVHNGSVQNIPGIPDDVKAIYKTVWEISQKKVLDLAADRGTISNGLSPLCDCDAPDKIFILSPRLRACDMPKFLSGLKKFARI